MITTLTYAWISITPYQKSSATLLAITPTYTNQLDYFRQKCYWESKQWKDALSVIHCSQVTGSSNDLNHFDQLNFIVWMSSTVNEVRHTVSTSCDSSVQRQRPSSGVLGGIRGYTTYTNLRGFFGQRILTSVIINKQGTFRSFATPLCVYPPPFLAIHHCDHPRLTDKWQHLKFRINFKRKVSLFGEAIIPL